MKYVDLHIHSEYTLGNGITKIPDLVKRAKDFGMESLALTDSGSIKGFKQFRDECEKYSIKPIFGCGFYIAPLGLDNPLTHHLVLIAKGKIGYENLLKLNHFSLNEGFKVKPRVNFEMLKKNSCDLISLTGGLGGVFDKPYLSGNEKLATDNIKKLKDIYSDNLYLELQDNGLENNKKMINVLTELSIRENIKTVVTGGSFYLDSSDYKECNRIRLENNNKELKNDGYYFKSPLTIYTIFKNNIKAVENSLLIAQNVLELEYYDI